MTAPQHTHWGVYAVGWSIVGGIVLAVIWVIGSAVWRAIT